MLEGTRDGFRRRGISRDPNHGETPSKFHNVPFQKKPEVKHYDPLGREVKICEAGRETFS